MAKYTPAPQHLRGAVVRCSRNGDGQATFAVELGDVRHACMAVARGGDFELFPDGRHRLSVMFPASLMPEALRSGRHRDPARWTPGREPSAYGVVERDGTDPFALAWLEVQGAKDVHSREHVLQRRAKRRRDRG